MTVEKVSVTVRLDHEIVDFLDRLAEVEDRDRSYLIKRAVANYVEFHRWQIDEIRKAVEEAEAGLFATEETTDRLFSKWTA